MVIRWDSEADAKVSLLPQLIDALLKFEQLFAAVIATSEVKLDYSKLAAIMGPGEDSSVPTSL